MVNEVALALLFGLFGWKVALLYLGLGLPVAIVAGLRHRRAEDGAPSRRLGARHAHRATRRRPTAPT
ncbi:MAG: permease [Chromatiales bacterium]|nr:permease [Chromatiales bacterium]